jgi:hypothetical protein
MNSIINDDVKDDLLQKYNMRAADVISGIVIYDIHELYNESSDADIPLRYIQFTDGTIVCSVAKECKEFIVDYFSKYSTDLFSDNGFEYLFKFLSDYMRKYQRIPYIANDEMYKHMIYYIFDDKKDVGYDKIKDNTVRFNSTTEYKNITDSYQPLWQGGIYFGTLVNKEIVSIVGTNTPLEKKVIDIGLETHIDYRQKGFALSNIAAMSNYLTTENKIVLYGCNNKNEDSIKTAISSRFKEIAKEKTLWFVGE